MNQIDLKYRHAVITGGAQGIGLDIALRLVESGARVTLWDKDEQILGSCTHAFGERRTAVSTSVVDVTAYDSVVAATERGISDHGKIDILVASAGIAGPNQKTWEYPLDEWRNVLNVNLTGVFHCCRALMPHMMDRNYGRVVNISSIAGKEGNPNASAYSASKAGVIALTKSLGKETAGYNIAVNCITPAVAKTRLFEQMTQEHISYMLSRIPRGRFVEVSEISSMVAWLVSEENSFTTGAVFDLSGGRATY